ncbi:MAG TPA: redoxin domain-containing protein [Saprospiraceae bacterium]|nr:redoxin domain-containing protein [Saprospiraceae bacterium]
MAKYIHVFLLLSCFSLNAGAQKAWHVYVFIGEECPICNYMGKPLSLIAEKFQDDVAFHAVFPVKNSNYKTARVFQEQYGLLSFETLLDKDQQLAKKLGASVTPEVVVTDDQGEIMYRGRINNAYYAPGKMKHSSIKNELDDALSLLTTGNQVPKPWPSAVGCYITMYATK